MMIPSKQTDRNFLIDTIRGFCIIFVILLHLNIREAFSNNEIAHFIPKSIYNIVFFSGYYGVAIFFVISGYLITNNSIRRYQFLEKIKLGEFYALRFSRIFPTLILILSILSLFHLLNFNGFHIKNTTLLNSLFSAITFHINYLEAKVGYLPGNWDILWSLSVEEVFYLFFPMICVLFRKNNFIIIILCAFILIGPIHRYYYQNINEMWSDHGYLSCMDGIAIGCLAAILANKLEFSKINRLFCMCSGLLLFLLVFVFKKFFITKFLSHYTLNISVLQISIGLILIASTVHNKTNAISNKLLYVLRSFGIYSYEIYLTHMFIVIGIFSLKKYLNIVGYEISTYLIVLLISLLLGKVLSKYFSEYCNQKLREKLL